MTVQILLLASMLSAAGQSAPTTLTVGRPTGKTISPLHFAVNCEFYRPGLYFGTLPKSDPRSKREEFARALKESGIRALRFPGGNAAYYYLPESRRKTMALAHATKHWAFRDNNPPSTHFVTLENLASFCREYDVKLIYELPVLFYLDGETPRAVIRSKFSQRAGNYDRDRIAEGAAYAQRMVKRLRQLGAPVAAWELGNEEFAHCDAKDYARVCAAYGEAIREADATTPIVAVGMGKGWLGTLVPELRRLGALKLITSYNAHYPFGNWPGPGDPSKRGDPNAFVSGNLKMERWLDAAERGRKTYGIPGAPISVTETTAMRHKNWTPRQVIATHAHALVYAWNWMALLEHPLCDMAVFHDLETPYFGMMRYDVGWDASARRFVWLKCAKPGQPLLVFADQYVLSPTCAASRLLSRLVGRRLCKVEGFAPGGRLRAIAGRSEAGVVMILVNRSPAARDVRINGVQITGATALTADDLAATLPGAFRLSKVAASGGAFRVPAWSVAAVEGR